MSRMIASTSHALRAACCGIAFMLFTSAGLADSWRPAAVEHYISANGNWKLTVVPRPTESPLAYFRDKVDGKARAGDTGAGVQAHALGHMERRRDGRWHSVWKQALANDVAPVDAIVSNTGVAVTFDNWHSMGYGGNVVVVYGQDGRQVRSFGLSAFLPGTWIEGLPFSVSSIEWRGEARVDETRQQLVIPVIVPNAEDPFADEEDLTFVDVRFRLSDGVQVPPSGHAWRHALASSKAAEAARRIAQQADVKRFVSPLEAPVGDEASDWYDYLDDAFDRLAFHEEGVYPSKVVLPGSEDRGYARQARSLGDALTRESTKVLLVASPSQHALVEAIRQQAARVKPGALGDVRIYVAADHAHLPAIRAALAHTRAKMFQIDIASPIPQRNDAIDRVTKEAAAADP